VHHPVKEFTKLDSTNSEAWRLVDLGERGPLWIRADRQDVGRGRSARSWLSPSGNLFATFLFSPQCAMADVHQLSLVVGIAACDTVRAFLEGTKCGGICRLKWPNDLMIGTAKAGGILVESALRGQEYLAIVGCGINIAIKPEIEGREVTAMFEYGARPRPQAFLELLDQNLCECLKLWDNGAGFDRVRQMWLQRSFPLGVEMSIKTNNGEIGGTFAGLAEDGALLLVLATGRRLRFNFGDVAIGSNAAKPEHQDDNKN